MSPRLPTLALAAVLALAGASAADDDETATIYQWMDSEGAYRYTPDLDRVPMGARDTVVTIVQEDPGPGDTPAYFEPDPRADEVTIPDPSAEGSEAPSAAPAPPLDEATRARIRELEAQIARDEEALKAYIAKPGDPATDEVPPELREIAERLPELQAELASLQGRAPSRGAP